MKTLLIALLFALPLAAQESDPRIAEGVALHDAGKYDEAIARYKAVLADDPANVTATYEMAFSYQMKNDFAQCRTLLEPLAEKAGRLQVAILTTLGNCLDSSGDAKAAIATYRNALQLAPEDPGALYNLAVALGGDKQYDEARATFEKELALRPKHANSRIFLASIFQAQNFRAPAILEYLRFLALEPATPRSATAAVRVLDLLDLGVSKTGRKTINIAVDPDARKEEGDFSAFEMMMGLLAGAKLGEKQKGSEFDAVRGQLASALAMLTESPQQRGSSYTETQNVPFFSKLVETKMLDTFAGRALAPANLKGTDVWLKKNAAALQELDAFLKTAP
ncbi:MAG TPA: tetratricopeptide repeat protein [Thermoanaerobaculia bacterium]|nr:tetratricopeptide repeat protein [Thermoanaerobaculia bacterium]